MGMPRIDWLRSMNITNQTIIIHLESSCVKILHQEHHDLDGFPILALGRPLRCMNSCESYVPDQLAFMIPLRMADVRGTHTRGRVMIKHAKKAVLVPIDR